jgi:23S rRNA (adenine2503-C2)-methyltransferase
VSVYLRHIPIKDISVPVLNVSAGNKNVLSVPTQIGCPVGCSFCVSTTNKFVRNLTADEIVDLVVKNAPNHPFVLSFTGEGDVLFNTENVSNALSTLYTLSIPITSVRYSISGVASRRIRFLDTTTFPAELQVSMHTFNQSIRDKMIPKSDPIYRILESVSMHYASFSKIRINYVLREGLNDTPGDITHLKHWGHNDWDFILNPFLTPNGAIVHPRVDDIAMEMFFSGRNVYVFRNVGEDICDNEIYNNLTYRQH